MNLCQRFHCLPSELYEEDAEILRLLKIVELGTPEEQEEGYEDA